MTNNSLQPNNISIEQALHKTLKRLWTHGKRKEIELLFSFAIFPMTFEELDQWVRLDDYSMTEQHKAYLLQILSADELQLILEKFPYNKQLEIAKSLSAYTTKANFKKSQDSVKDQVWFHKEHSEKSAEIDRDSISLDMSNDTSLAQRLGLKYNSPIQRHKVGNELARGGIGRVLRSRDRQLLRSQVLKTLNRGTKASERVMLNFIREARITAQLEHPHIVPVHDLGLLPNGEVYFAMKRIRGFTLKEILRALRKNENSFKEKYSRANLLGIFLKMCQAVAFAHSRGVLHRDLKPSNVMVGDFGEVLVLDWGVAKVFQSEDVIQKVRCPEGDGIGRSSVVGTPAYMSPEQAQGDNENINIQSDIYSLGATLYEILTYRPPFRGKDSRKLILQAIEGNPVPPKIYKPTHHIPQALEDITMRCLAKEQSDRYLKVDDLIDAIVYYLNRLEDLERRFKICYERYIEANKNFKRYKTQLTKKQNLLSEQIELQWETLGKKESSDRRPLWLKKIEVQELNIEIQESYRKTESLLRDALSHYSDHTEAKELLAYLYSIQLEIAESNYNQVEISYYQDLLKQYDQGSFQALLSNRGRIQIITQPLECDIYASKGVEIDLDLQFLKDQPWGRAPLNEAQILNGYWQIKVTAEGYRDAIYPVLVRRNHLIDIQCRLYKEEDIPKGFIYIPKGNILLTGYDDSHQNRKTTEIYLEDFAIRKTLITCGEYLQFLNDLCTMDKILAAKRVPRLPHLNMTLWPQDEHEKYILPSPTSSMPWSEDWPIFSISYRDAEAFCRWYSRRLNVPVRLPTEYEWEKAGQGLDQRTYPWGNYFDESFYHNAIGKLGQYSHPISVSKIEKDCSPYGVYDMSGLVSEFCNVERASINQFKILKGSNFESYNEQQARIDYHIKIDPNYPIYTAGFRVVMELKAN